ncbi:type IV toxin-antitoxin system AbiEi family antitoxin [Christiangramia sp. SM2212]|uniref:Type IV toxin-antitoxin system AbiEi family antitoxin n=1 Tax=Christiangramia sediminicola TaxID=3073267 RepID=A0ABU1ESF9_9FLAO|nr:type IV toxin-antitoxin system AbiEi family antitoxin [Christiangramia sp. SM2212]MDR5591327.1 type IV toxin-antitoxin system AbiEi family antitoxin [Christiangramia sp. SM2212]
MYRNNDFIYDATLKLEQLIDIPIQVDSNRNNHDALLTIKNIQFVVEAKAAVRTSNQGFILSQLEEMKNNSNRPIILIAEYISKKATHELKERGINYIDVAGNSFIKYEDLAIFVEGQKNTKKDKTNQSRAFQETGLKIIFHLLNTPEHLQDSYRRIAEQADVSIGSVSNVMAELEELNYLLKTKQKRAIKNTDELLERWVVEFNAVLRPRILRKRMRFIDQDQSKNWRDIDIHTENGVLLWGGEPGGAIITENLRPEKFTVFTDLELSEVANKLRLIPSENGEIEILQKFWKNDANYAQVAPALLVYADLMNSGFGRNIETAKQILKNELQHI